PVLTVPVCLSEPEASEESPPAEEEEAEASAAPADAEEDQKAADEEPTENGEKVDGGSRTKKVKRTIPLWASVAAHKNVPVTNFAGTQHRMDNILIEALRASSDKSGVSFKSLMKYLLDKHPGMELTKKTFFIKKALKKHLEKGTIKQLKGKGLSGSFVIGKQPAPPKVSRNTKYEPPVLFSLGDALPLIITQLCEPKEASYNLIKKYLEQHFPISKLPQTQRHFKCREIPPFTAKVIFTFSDRFQTPMLVFVREVESYGDFRCDRVKFSCFDFRPESLKTALVKAVEKGHLEQITGKGARGTFQVLLLKKTPRGVTFHQSGNKPQPKGSVLEEAITKRPPPKARRPPPAKKARSSGPVKSRGKAFAKKSPAKKAPPPAKKAGRKQPASKKEAAPPKETPVKKAAPSRKPKTPAVKKLSARGSKRPPPKESTPEKDDKTAKSRSRSSRSEESSPEEPAAKKQPAKGKRSQPKKTPPTVKTGAKSSKQPARQSKRGRR
uniref:Heterochromatin protein 1-binding protein 3 n=1 Tax=Oryzias latipes TaxID=8090 RepID=A0A3P9HCL0_ORYLA